MKDVNYKRVLVWVFIILAVFYIGSIFPRQSIIKNANEAEAQTCVSLKPKITYWPGSGYWDFYIGQTANLGTHDVCMITGMNNRDHNDRSNFCALYLQGTTWMLTAAVDNDASGICRAVCLDW